MTPSYDMLRTALDEICRDGFFYVHLEPTNACNTTCVMCPRDAMVRKMNMMSQEILEQVVTVLLPPQVPMVSIVGFGEPTLHPRLVEMIRYIKVRRPDIIIKMTTNGSRLTPSFIDSVYEAGLDLMEISVVGTDPDAYKVAMGGLDLDTVRRAITYLNGTTHRYLLATFPQDDASPDTLRQYWTSQGARNIEVKGFHRRGGYLPQPVTLQLRGNPLGEYQPRPDTTHVLPDEKAQSTIPVDACHKLYMFLHINAHGNLIPCVQEINNRNVLAHISEVHDFDEVRHLLRSHRPAFDICRGCELQSQDQLDYYTRFLLNYFPERVDRLVRSAFAQAKAHVS